MLRYVAVRLLQGLLVIFLISVVTFGLMHLAPGNPVDIMIGEAQVTQEQIDAIMRKWGFDRPLHEQYLTWLRNVATGDFGQSVIRTGVPVGEMLREAAPATIRLNILALSVAVLIAIPAGILAATKRNSVFDFMT